MSEEGQGVLLLTPFPCHAGCELQRGTEKQIC